jgi:type II secretory pathway component GspD/PulD (secretin)
MSKFLLAVALPILIAAATTVHAGDKTITFNYEHADITKVLKDYAAASGQRFIVDPQVRGQITIINPGPVTVEEAFNQLSTAMATNGIAYVLQDGVMNVKQARQIQRDSIPLVTELPPMRPEKMVTYMITLKHISADEVNKQLRILTSKDGELVPYTPTNTLIVSDWTPNLHRIAEMLGKLDTAEAAANGAKFPAKHAAWTKGADNDEDSTPHFNATKPKKSK